MFDDDPLSRPATLRDVIEARNSILRTGVHAANIIISLGCGALAIGVEPMIHRQYGFIAGIGWVIAVLASPFFFRARSRELDAWEMAEERRSQEVDLRRREARRACPEGVNREKWEEELRKQDARRAAGHPKYRNS